MFAAPPEATLEWSDAGVEGAFRFLRRLWTYATGRGQSHAEHATNAGAKRIANWSAESKAVRDFRYEIHNTLRQASYDYERIQYNTVVSAAMKMLNALEGAGPEAAPVLSEALSILLRILYPMAPHITHVLWEELGHAKALGDLMNAPWPEVDARALVQDEIELVVQVNGKLRGSIRVAAATRPSPWPSYRARSPCG